MASGQVPAGQGDLFRVNASSGKIEAFRIHEPQEIAIVKLPEACSGFAVLQATLVRLFPRRSSVSWKSAFDHPTFRTFEAFLTSRGFTHRMAP